MAETLGTNDSVSAHRVSVFRTTATRGVVFVLCFILGIVSATIAADDSYIAGYAAAVLQHEFNAAKASLHVQEGVVIVTPSRSARPTEQRSHGVGKIPGVVRVEIREGRALSHSARSRKPESKFLPHGLLFAPFHADPRWPHFSIAYRSITLGRTDYNGSANFGETFALYRDAAPLNGQWEIAIQAGVFSISI